MAELKRVILRSRPFLYDKVIQDMQQTMADALPWLDHIFGRAERLVKKIDGIRQYTPNVYLGKGEYLPVTPDSRLGNYSFFQRFRTGTVHANRLFIHHFDTSSCTTFTQLSASFAFAGSNQ